MALYAPPFWSPYDHPYNIFDKMHPYSHPYQQYPMYRVPPVYHPLTPPFAEQTHSPGKYGTTSPSSHPAEALKSPKRRTVCREKSSQVDRPGETERTVRDDRSRPSIDAQGPYGEPKTTGSSRRDATPESTGSESPGDTPSYCRVLTFQDQNGQSREMVFPKALDLDRPKRARTSFTLHQLERLEKEFKSNQYMVGRDRAQLAKNLDLTEIQVKVWYQNRRTKFKREQCRAAEFQEKNAESFAACNILRLLHNRDVSIAPSVGPVSPRQSRLPSW